MGEPGERGFYFNLERGRNCLAGNNVPTASRSPTRVRGKSGGYARIHANMSPEQVHELKRLGEIGLPDEVRNSPLLRTKDDNDHDGGYSMSRLDFNYNNCPERRDFSHTW